MNRTGNFKINVGEIINDKRNLVITSREYRIDKNEVRRKWYKYTCKKCGWTEGWIEESKLITNKRGCSCCANKTAVLGINTIWDTDRWMCDLGVDKEEAKKFTKGSTHKIKCICPHCNSIMYKTIGKIYLRKSISCNRCGDGFSYPEKFMCSMLNQLGVEFKTQYSPNYLNGKKSDFYIPCLNLIIETDGELGHKGGKIHSKSKKTIEEYINDDNWKDEQHLLHSIETIRIDCFKSDIEYIKSNILKSKLNNTFNLSNICWNTCEEFALNNLIKEVCNYWNINKQSSLIELSNLFNLHTATIIKYLKKGSSIGICDYTPTNGGKKVEILKNDISLGVFNNCHELSRQSVDLFGIKLDNSKISMVCNNKRNKHKGYTFRYV